MTAYCTLADMAARYDPRRLVQLTDRPADDTVQPATAVTESVLDQAIADASALIDTYLSVVTPLPLAEVPPRLVACCCALTFASLFQDAIPEKAGADRDRELQWLRDVRDNKIRLFPDGTTTEGEGVGMPETDYPCRVFDARKLRDGL